MEDKHRYETLRSADERRDSSTEVDDWDTERDAQPWRRKRKTLWRKVKGYRWMLDTALLLLIAGLLVKKRWTRHASHRFEVAGDITGFAPSFSQQIVTFKPNPIFAPANASDFWSTETQQAWLSIVPEGLGYVEVKDPSQYNNLPTSIHDYANHTVFTTSVTHQLHCLYTILSSYNKLKIAVTSPNRGEAPKMSWHMDHCFEYIRQAIMCAGDVALEGAATTFPLGDNGEDLGGSDGWDAKHVCRDYSQVYDYLEAKTINHQKWISSD